MFEEKLYVFSGDLEKELEEMKKVAADTKEKEIYAKTITKGCSDFLTILCC